MENQLISNYNHQIIRIENQTKCNPWENGRLTPQKGHELELIKELHDKLIHPGSLKLYLTRETTLQRPIYANFAHKQQETACNAKRENSIKTMNEESPDSYTPINHLKT
jgi:hypothetical protein